MRILLIADIHANWAALRTIAEEPHDVCICLGDLVDYGLDPAPCIEWVKKNSHHCVRGNHDHGVAQRIPVDGKAGYRFLTGVTRQLTWQRIESSHRLFLSQLPLTKVVSLDSTNFFLVHATPRDPLDEFAPNETTFWTRRLEGIDCDVVCVGHTHQPYVLEVEDKIVINPGSVGQPRDGDPRASYAIIENFTVDLKRVEYPIEETVDQVLDSELPEKAKDLLSAIYRTGTPMSAMSRSILEGESEPIDNGDLPEIDESGPA